MGLISTLLLYLDHLSLHSFSGLTPRNVASESTSQSRTFGRFYIALDPPSFSPPVQNKLLPPAKRMRQKAVPSCSRLVRCRVAPSISVIVVRAAQSEKNILEGIGVDC